MHRKFEEVGVTIGSVPYGHFAGEAQFDENGQVVQIDLEDERFAGPALTLDIEQLIRERIALEGRFAEDIREYADEVRAPPSDRYDAA